MELVFKLSNNPVYLISRVLCKGNRHCFYGMNLHSESAVGWQRSQVACSYCKLKAKPPKSFFTFNEIWIISVRENMLHEFYAKKLRTQICPPPIFIHTVKARLLHKTFTSQFLYLKMKNCFLSASDIKCLLIIQLK
jgi:hypothetical protein